jgi:hypothetical protein
MVLPRSSWTGCVAAAALLLSRANAAEPPRQLGWDAPEVCPGGRFVEAEVSRVVGRPWAELAAEWRTLEASVRPEAGGYRLRLRLVSNAGIENERSVLAASCTEAAEAAVAILTAGVARPSSSPRPQPPEARAALQPAPPVRPEHDVPRAEPEPGRARSLPFVGARLGLDIGSLARPAPLAQLTGGIELGRLALAGVVGATGNVSAELGDSAAGAEMFLVFAGPELCVRLGPAALSVSVCGGAELGSLEARGFGAAQRRTGRTLWSAALVRGGLDWQIGDSGTLSAGVTTLVPLRRLHVISSPEEVHRTALVAVRPWLGVGVRFP